ncbi:DUF2269 family protein [Paenibacillus sp. LHD-117]|uniref:DUF2269 family protein n=1 Tax=Paenibacillus sp. LHD-117 TaxID=3071412 RepID=UPI0027E168BA|nr:DUF2269 family protein [Paenibacillus sp. LHD-117]MDQ6419866.1 DUF2269 family protein [Paenibacillus sp. LHD-117]
MEKIFVFLHVLGAMLFLGNIITTAFWKLQADRSRDPEQRHRAALAVMRADYALTIPGLILLVVFGVLTAHAYGYSMAELNWLTASIGLFALSGILWGAVLLLCQLAMIRHSESGIPSGELPKAYDQASARWNLWGTVNTIIPIIVLFLMVVKP